jgi:acyl-CoA-binding protein
MDTENEKRDENPKIDPRLANLRPPFSSENQPDHNGRPKGALSLVTLMKKLAQAEFKGKAKDDLREMYGDDVADRISNAHLYMARVHEAAGKGEEWAIKLLLNYIDGMPVQAVNLGGQKDNPIQQDVYIVQNTEQKELLEKHSTTSDDL